MSVCMYVCMYEWVCMYIYVYVYMLVWMDGWMYLMYGEDIKAISALNNPVIETNLFMTRNKLNNIDCLPV